MKALYGAAAFVVAGLTAWGLLVYPVAKENADARAKAQALVLAFDEAGLTAPSIRVATRVFGTDGGHVCADPGAALRRAAADVSLSNGAAHVGVRPVVAARRVVEGELLVLRVYCPEQLAGFVEYVDGLRLTAG
ncbi:hypothetical protein Val02_47670 [Virgisporangium aliadipatigenens]|uniref:Uncharacterized protein n=1 Tax=Virgisporangium aliadipatigenens TaxID=741659 RepID=A0A8J3YMD3_9ACTN|nr:hypothetical protein [Virgisporangium aliadipatigenens]GIJ47881.1 hypothetical protein Val02_47670 [Virgisporangium aliadipatigenens]